MQPPTDDLTHSINFNRPPRRLLPELPPQTVELPPPPAPPQAPDQSWLITVVPVLGIGAMAVFYLLVGGGRSGLFAIPLLLLAGITAFGAVAGQRARRRDHERRIAEGELNYLRLLERKRAQLHAAQTAQLAILHSTFPDAQTALRWALAREQRLWERRPENTDFVAFRLGLGRVPSQIQINTPEADADHDLLERSFSIAENYRHLDNAPVVHSLQSHCALGIYGHRQRTLPIIRAYLGHLAATHAPQDLHIYVIAPQTQHDDWRWLEWLPHTNPPGSANLLAFERDTIRNLFGNLSQRIDERRRTQNNTDKQTPTPHFLLVIDDPQLAESEAVFASILREGAQIGASALCVVSSYDKLPGDCNAVIAAHDDGSLSYSRTDGFEVGGLQPETLSAPDAEHLARSLAAITVREAGSAGRIPRQVDFLDLYGVQHVDDLRETLYHNWRRPVRKGMLPFPAKIGRESLAVDTEIHLDEDHHGPHGVLAGTTGSGKSELMQTLVCSLVIEHDPRLLTLLLIDFKGGSTFNVFADLPHTVGVVTNLDRVRVERALEALRAEIHSRQQFLERMDMRDVTQYHRYYARGMDTPKYQPMPHLFIIVDEFAQLAKSMPEFMAELVRIAQVGRSLGLHLILGTQSPMDVITDEMNDNLQFRICLRVQNIEASRAMLRRPDAAYLPPGWPGRGYFQVGERGMFKQFQTAYVGGDYRKRMADDQTGESLVLELITDSGASVNLLPDADSGLYSEEVYTTARAISEMIINHAHQQQIPQMPPLLLQPLPEQMTLVQPFAQGLPESGGWNGHEWVPLSMDNTGDIIRTGSAPVGLVDDVYNRQQYPLWVHLNSDPFGSGRREGHVMVVGGPSTGKTTFIRTLAVSQALLHSPDRLHLYFLSFTGGGLNDLSELPHAETVILGTETERVRRLFARLIALLNERQRIGFDFTQPTTILCIDQFEQFRDTYYEQHMRDFERIIHEGRAVGLYIVMTASTIAAIPERLRSLVQQRIALGGTTDYTLIVGRVNTPDDLPPGRGYIAHNPPLTCQISLPSLQRDPDPTQSLTHIIAEMRSGYLRMSGVDDEIGALSGQLQSPLPVKKLPTYLPLDRLPVTPEPDSKPRLKTALGRYDDDGLSLFTLDWWEHGPHFVVTGPPGSGKTNLLQTAVLTAAQDYSPEMLRVLLVDFGGRSLRSLRRLKHVIDHVTTIQNLEQHISHLQADLAYLLESEHAPEHPPKTVIVIDDYDMTGEALGAGHPLFTQMRDLAQRYGEFGLHFWVAGYFERAVDPLIKQLMLRRSGFAFGSRESLQNLHIRAANIPPEMLPAGRAYVVDHGAIQVIQTAYVEKPVLYVNRINEQLWPGHSQAAWLQNGRANTQATQQRQPRNLPDVDTQGLIEDLLGNEGDQ